MWYYLYLDEVYKVGGWSLVGLFICAGILFICRLAQLIIFTIEFKREKTNKCKECGRNKH